MFFFFNDTATTEIYTLSLHDALPISSSTTSTLALRPGASAAGVSRPRGEIPAAWRSWDSSWCKSMRWRSEEHTSELQSQFHLVCRLLLEKKKKNNAALTPLLHACYEL